LVAEGFTEEDGPFGETGLLLTDGLVVFDGLLCETELFD